MYIVSDPRHLRQIKVGNKKKKLGLNQGIAANRKVSPQIAINQNIRQVTAGNIDYLLSVKIG